MKDPSYIPLQLLHSLMSPKAGRRRPVCRLATFQWRVADTRSDTMAGDASSDTTVVFSNQFQTIQRDNKRLPFKVVDTCANGIKFVLFSQFCLVITCQKQNLYLQQKLQ